MAEAGPAVPASEVAPIRQRAVLVLPSNGEFDSRTYRIARTLVERGHSVTVLAVLMGDVAAEEQHPLGYRIIRVPASSIDGLPLQPLVRFGRWLARGARASRRRRQDGPPDGAAQRRPVSSSAAMTPPAGPARRAATPKRIASGLVRRLAIPLTLRSYARNARIVAPAADLFHGMAFMGIPIALELARHHRSRSVYDARDIYLDARNLARMRGPARWLIARGERGWARRAGRVVTINQAFADVMRARWQVDPLVVMNCSYRFVPPEPPERRFHAALGLPPGRRVVLYHGGFFPHRGVEELLVAIREIPDTTLVLMGYGVLEPVFRARADAPELADRVRLLPAVPPDELLFWVAGADVVAMPIQPTTLNHRLTTPNKLLEAMAAGVPVVASDLPGMATIVRETGCGLLVDPEDPSALATAIRALLDAPPEERSALRRRCLAAAHATYNWETQVTGLLSEYTRLTGRPW